MKPVNERGANKVRIGVDIESCYGCHVCELICSFHKAEVFSPYLSSIRVLVNNRTGEIKFYIDESSCDLCKSEEQPLCIKYCSYHCLRIESAR